MPAKRKAAPVAEDVLRVEGTTTPAKTAKGLAGMFAAPSANVEAAYTADDTAGKAVEGDSLKALRALAQELVEAERTVEEKNKALTNAQIALADVQENRLPKLMKEHDLKKFEFTDARTGITRTIKFESKWRVQLPTIKVGNQHVADHEARKPVFQWFREQGLGGVIKKDVVVPVGLLSDEFAANLMQAVKDFDSTLDPGLAEKIEPATLTAQVTRLKEAGTSLHPAIKCEPVERAKVLDK